MPVMAHHPDKLPRRGSRNTLKKEAQKVVKTPMFKRRISLIQECIKSKWVKDGDEFKI